MIKDSLKTIALSLVVLSLVGVAYAWTEPTVAPPNQDPTISKPLTESKTGQVKAGGLWIGADAAAVANSGGKGLIVENGYVGFGTANPGAKLESQAPTTGSYNTAFRGTSNDGTKSIDFNIQNDGKANLGGNFTSLGIGTTNPQGKFSICDNGACADFIPISENMGEDIYLPQNDIRCSRTGNISPHPTFGTYKGETGAHYQCTVDDAGSFYTNRFWTGANVCQCGCEVVYQSNCVLKRTMRLFER